MSRGHDRAAVVTVGAVVLAALLAGCAVEDPSTSSAAAPVDASLEHAGLWADDFRAALDHGVSDYETRILADGRITTAEVEDAHERVGRCLEDSGYTIAYEPDGGFEVGRVSGGSPSDDMQRTNSVLEGCEERYDQFVTMLFEETRRNPEKQDEAAITVACLRREGLVGAGYSERTWRAENDEDSFSFPEFDERAQQCTLDPLGLWRDR